MSVYYSSNIVNKSIEFFLSIKQNSQTWHRLIINLYFISQCMKLKGEKTRNFLYRFYRKSNTQDLENFYLKFWVYNV